MRFVRTNTSRRTSLARGSEGLGDADAKEHFAAAGEGFAHEQACGARDLGGQDYGYADRAAADHEDVVARFDARRGSRRAGLPPTALLRRPVRR
ncbi:hypothetical protein ACRAWF_23190 [Streptomyces sp. L7]